VLALFAQLAATYLTLATDDAALRDDFRRRALQAGIVSLVAAGIAAWLVADQAAGRSGILAGPRSTLWVVVAAIAALIGIVALWRRSFLLARLAVCTEVSLIVWGWAAAQYTYVVPSSITIRGSAAAPATLDELLIALAAGVLLLTPSLAYLLRTFAAHGAATSPTRSDQG